MEESREAPEGTFERAKFVADEAPLAARCMASLNTWHHCIENQAGWLVFGAALIVGATIPIQLAFELPKAWPFWGTASLLLFATLVLFTRPFDKRENIYGIFRFAWGFVGTCVLASGMLLYTTARPPFKDPHPARTELDANLEAKRVTNEVINAPEVKEALEQSGATVPAAPTHEIQERLGSAYKKEDEFALDQRLSRQHRFTLITVVHGCDYHRPPSRANDETRVRTENELPYNPAMPEGVYCGELPPQWVISIGGSIMRCHFDGTCPQSKPPVVEATKLRAELQVARAALTKLRASQAGMDTRISEARLAEKRDWKTSGPDSRTLESQQGSARAGIANLEQKVADYEAQLESMKGWSNQTWNIAGAPIVGGIVVPVYFVIMTIIGAIIGLFRKLPEFQDRVEPAYPVEYKKRLADGESPLPPISPERARELVVFQILQVVFAPAIGILAYSYARPNEIASTVVLAFGAGFSSELILVAVRATVDRLIGLGPRPTLARAAGNEPANRNELPPPGPVKPSPPTESGGFKVGDRVTLEKSVGILMAGSQGIVMSIGEGGVLNVRSTQDNQGVPVEIMLDPKPPDFFRHASQDKNGPDGPVG